MERLRQKRPRLVLEPAEYDRLRNHVLARDDGGANVVGRQPRCWVRCGSILVPRGFENDPLRHMVIYVWDPFR
jgi:hypothetical protein